MLPKIMIVEGEALVALDIKELLRDAGFEVVAVVPNGATAVAKAQQTTPDLALIDVGVNGPLDGIELAQVLKNRLNLPCVFLTTDHDEQAVARVKPTDPLSFIVKPYRDAELLGSIRLALRRSGRRATEAARPWAC